eukprot:50794-Eustigmatos_ZCMA.PRE.1
MPQRLALKALLVVISWLWKSSATVLLPTAYNGPHTNLEKPNMRKTYRRRLQKSSRWSGFWTYVLIIATIARLETRVAAMESTSAPAAVPACRRHSAGYNEQTRAGCEPSHQADPNAFTVDSDTNSDDDLSDSISDRYVYETYIAWCDRVNKHTAIFCVSSCSGQDGSVAGPKGTRNSRTTK